MMSYDLAFAPIIVPLIGALLLLGIDRAQAYVPHTSRSRILIAVLADIVGLASSAFILFVLYAVYLQHIQREPFEATLFSWIPRDNFDLSLTIRADGLALFFLSICGFTVFGLLLASAHGLAHVLIRLLPPRQAGDLRLPEPLAPRYQAAVLLIYGLVAGIILWANLLIIYVFWELLTITCYFLLLDTTDNDPGVAQRMFLTTHLTGYALLAAVLILGNSSAGTYLYTVIRPVYLSRLPLGLFLVAAIGKSGLYPFSTWVLQAERGAPLATALIHSIVLPTGIYLLLLAHAILAGPFPADITLILQLIAVISVVSATILAWRQQDLRSVLCYHSVVTFGFVLLSLSLNNPLAITAGLILIAGHTPLKAMALLSLDHLPHQRGAGEERPWTSLFLSLSLAGMSGIPVSIAMVGLWLLVVTAIEQSAWLVAIIVLIAWLSWLVKFIQQIVEFYQPPLTPEAIGIYAERRNIPWLLGTALLGLSGLVINGYAQGALIALLPLATQTLAPNNPPLRPTALSGVVDLPMLVWLPLSLVLFMILLFVPPLLAAWLKQRRVFIPIQISTPITYRRRGRVKRITESETTHTILAELEDVEENQPNPVPATEPGSASNPPLQWFLQPDWIFALLWQGLLLLAAFATRFMRAVETRYYLASIVFLLLAMLFLLLV